MSIITNKHVDEMMKKSTKELMELKKEIQEYLEDSPTINHAATKFYNEYLELIRTCLALKIMRK